MRVRVRDCLWHSRCLCATLAAVADDPHQTQCGRPGTLSSSLICADVPTSERQHREAAGGTTQPARVKQHKKNCVCVSSYSARHFPKQIATHSIFVSKCFVCARTFVVWVLPGQVRVCVCVFLNVCACRGRGGHPVQWYFVIL